jgi:hypothetical protein
MEQRYCKCAFSLADCGGKVKRSCRKHSKGPKTGIDGLRGTNISRGMVEYEETGTSEPGSRSQPIVIIGELRLKVATGSRKAEELYREVKLFRQGFGILEDLDGTPRPTNLILA